jgi:hypothetical protein
MQFGRPQPPGSRLTTNPRPARVAPRPAEKGPGKTTKGLVGLTSVDNTVSGSKRQEID